ncbi:VanZ family protein [Kangiella sp. M94]
MRLIWYIVILFIVYGSLYPFDFELGRDLPDDFSKWLFSWHHRTIRSDLIANILLFIPYGFFGALTIKEEHRRWPLLWIGMTFVGGFLFALFLQLLQFYLPSRIPEAADALTNSIGILIGFAIAGFTNSQRVQRLIPRGLRFQLTPALLVLVLWLAWQFFPYIPVFESKQFGDGLIHITQSGWSLQLWLERVLFWMVFYYVLERVVAKKYSMTVIIGITVFVLIIKLAMLRSQIGWSEISAVPLAILLHAYLGHGFRVAMVVIGTATLFIWQNLFPWQWQSSMNSFEWMPFDNFLTGSTWNNLSALLRESLLLACFGYFLGKWLSSYKTAGAVLTLFVVGVTALQFFIVGKQPDSTSIVMALVIAILFQRLARIAP